MTSDAVSVVVAGPVSPFLPDALQAVRKHMPGSEVILSTWRGSVQQDYDVDVLVENEDPGTVAPTRPGPYLAQNTNRMLRSARRGIERATRPYVLKLRTDAVLEGTGFLQWWDLSLPRGTQLRVFDRRILTVHVAARPGRRMLDYLFHPSDCVHFGTAEDVTKLWSVQEIAESRNTNVPAGRYPKHNRGPLLFNEQCLWLGALRGAGHRIDYPHWQFRSPELVTLSETSVANNFLVLEDWQFGVHLPKLADMVRRSAVDSYVWLDDWRAAARSSMGAS